MSTQRGEQHLDERHLDERSTGRRLGGAPQRFRWRSRAYRVEEVLDTWFEPAAWWLAASTLDGAGADGRVWRVLAASGPGGTNTFELVEATPQAPASVRAVD